MEMEMEFLLLLVTDIWHAMFMKFMDFYVGGLHWNLNDQPRQVPNMRK